jgi:glycosyltransferase involved in cell wall biosynthesis
MFMINGRFQAHRPTGMQRYALELCNRFRSHPRLVQPGRPLKGVLGHAWEQTVLPRGLASSLLWSPCNTGPLSARRHIVTIHDLIPLEHPEWFGARFSLLYRLLLPNLVKRATHLAAVSLFTKMRLMRLLGVDESKITVIENGIGEEFEVQPEAEVIRVRRALKIPEGPYLLSVCSLEPRKNLARLLDAWTHLGQKRDGATLVVAGGKGSSSVFQSVNLAEQPDSVLFTGYVADGDLPALYSGAQAFVYPSLYEGFGLPVLEALACGTRVIASNTTSIPEIAGVHATLIDPLSIEEISRAMGQVLMSVPQPAESKVRYEHARRFTWRQSASRTEQLLLSYC